MIIYNVLFKGVEIKINPYCKAFRTEKEVDDYVQHMCETKDLRVCSTMGWDDDFNVNDYRLEDSKGNTYYYVVYRQAITDVPGDEFSFLI